MKNSKNVVLFLILVLVLMWNPLTSYIYYSEHVVYDSKILSLIFWLIPIIGVIAIVYIKRKDTVSPRVEGIVFNSAYVGILLGFLVLINFLIGVFTKPDTSNPDQVLKNEGLIFKPNSAAVYTTVEFNYRADINGLGLRNKEIKVEKEKGTYRILCFGDSWTFGWGVDVEYSWPMQMENYLKANGYTNVEVINCGQGGQFTSTYKEFISRAVPVLKPDLVLVGVLQLDDLAQLFENKLAAVKANVNSPKFFLKAFLMASFGNYLKLVAQNNSAIEIRTVWEGNNNDLIKDFSGMRKLRFTTLTDTIQTLFRTGNLNPGLLNNYIDFPDRVTIFNNPNHPTTQEAKKEMTEDFEKMNAVCKANGAALMFLNLPMNYFTGHVVERMPSDVLNGYYQQNNNIDSIYASIAKANQLPYFQLTQHFIDLPEKEKYFFKYDGHPNKIGYQEIATEIGKHLIEAQYVVK
ncbi:MAG: SGNH/GDSL hydrolase family protein [Cytophagales bacterium]|nr:SGNH/GDSL hydrolase family protein [Cytophagales bacterium]